jgi:hypothetical protein
MLLLRDFFFPTAAPGQQGAAASWIDAGALKNPLDFLGPHPRHASRNHFADLLQGRALPIARH